MGYYDGNTVTALWNYAQRYALNDNSFGTVFGPSTPGALNLISGQTNAVATTNGISGGSVISDLSGGQTAIGDPDPLNDVCSSATTLQVRMSGKNIRDLLNAADVTWGWFNGGFNRQTVNTNGTTGCLRSTVSPFVGVTAKDYSPHHRSFQYYASTANPLHTPPASANEIGHNGPANRTYDSSSKRRALA